MIRLGNGRKISNVLFSTCLGHSGEGLFPYVLWPPYRELLRIIKHTSTTIIAKSATRFKRIGNFVTHKPWTWRAVQRLPNRGMLNSYGLTNPGVIECAKKNARTLTRGFEVIPNFFPEFSKGITQAITDTIVAIRTYATILAENFWAIELNVSCPNSGEDFTKFTEEVCKLIGYIKECFPWLVVIVKISIRHPYEFSEELKRSGVDVIHAVNTVPWEMVYKDRPSPIADLGGGGVSGGPTHELTFYYCAGLRERIEGPMIWGCIATKSSHITAVFERFGKTNNSVSMCTAGVRDPLGSKRIALEFNG